MQDQHIILADEMIQTEYRPFFKTPHNHDTLAETMRTSLVCQDKSLTDQSFKEDADINTIIDRAKQGHEFPVPLPEHFGVDERVDLYTARSRIAESNATFYNLPPHVRAQFMNDPGRWEQSVLAALDKGDRQQLREMGLDVPEPPAAPQEAISSPGAPGEPGAAPAAPENPKKSDKPQ